MKRTISILFYFSIMACSLLTGSEKRTMPLRKQSMLFDAIANKDMKTIESLMQRYDIESFVPKNLFEEQHTVRVEQKKRPKKLPKKQSKKLPKKQSKKKQKKKPKKKPSQKRKKQKQKMVKETNSKEGQVLFQAVEVDDRETVAALLDENERKGNLSEQDINNIFLRTVKSRNDFRFEIAELFLQYQKVRDFLRGYILDDVFIRSVQLYKKPLFYAILRYKELRAKLYINEETGQKNKQTWKRFESHLKRMVKWNPKLLDKFLLHDDLLKKVKHLACITQDIIDHVFTLKDYGLYDAVCDWDLGTVKKILKKHAKKLHEESVNRAFIQSLTKGKEVNLKLSIAFAFLENKYIKKKLYRTSLDRGIMRSVWLRCRIFFSKALRDKFVRRNIGKSKETEERFIRVLKRAAEHAKNMLVEFLSYSDLRKRFKHLPFVTSKILDKARTYKSDFLFYEGELSEEENELLKAVELRKAERVSEILDHDHEALGEETVNEAFYRAFRGMKQFNAEITQVFLEHHIIKRKLKAAMLDKAAIKFVWRNNKKLFLIIFEDDFLRRKLYTSPDTEKHFEQGMRYASRNRRGVFLRIMYSNLDFFERIKEIDLEGHSVNNEADEDISTGNSSSEDQSSDDESDQKETELKEDDDSCVIVQKLSGAIEGSNVTFIKEFLDKSLEKITVQALNELFVKTITGEDKNDFRFTVTKLFLKHDDAKRLLSGASLDKLARVSCYFYKKDLLSCLLDDCKLRKKLYTNSKTKKDFENILKHVAQYNKKYLKMFLSKKDLRIRFSQKTRNIIFKELMMIDDLTEIDFDLLKICLDDSKFCDDIKNATLVEVLGFINDVFAGSDKTLKKYADRALEKACDSLDLEDTIFDICTTKRYSFVLNKFGEVDGATEEEENDESEFFKEADASVSCTLTQAFLFKNKKHIKYILEHHFDSIDPSEFRFVFVNSFYRGHYDVIATFLSFPKFRKLLTGELLDNFLDILNIYDNEQMQAGVKNVIEQMCHYKELKKRMVASVQKNNFQSLKKYIKVCWI